MHPYFRLTFPSQLHPQRISCQKNGKLTIFFGIHSVFDDLEQFRSRFGSISMFALGKEFDGINALLGVESRHLDLAFRWISGKLTYEC